VLNSITISDPIFLRNLLVYPIRGGGGNGFSPLTVNEVLNINKAEFHELDAPDVNRIIFENRSDNPVLMLDGEEITGSLQNRIVAMSGLVEARSSQNIPVICAEEGRWDEIGGFQTGHCSYPHIRTILAKSLHKKIDTQNMIWKEISRKLTVTKTLSKTSSMHDIYANLEDEMSRYVEDFRSLNHKTIGFIGIAGKHILGCDIFANPKIYRKYENKLIRSYALDAFEYQRTKDNGADVEKFFKGLKKVLNSKKIGQKIRNIKIKGDKTLGQALAYQNKIIHLSVFPV
jgi:hypothetical protein